MTVNGYSFPQFPNIDSSFSMDINDEYCLVICATVFKYVCGLSSAFPESPSGSQGNKQMDCNEYGGQHQSFELQKDTFGNRIKASRF